MTEDRDARIAELEAVDPVEPGLDADEIDELRALREERDAAAVQADEGETDGSDDTAPIEPGADFINGDSVIERIAALELATVNAAREGLDADLEQELADLSELSNMVTLEGRTMIRQSYFQTYCQDETESLYGVDIGTWPFTYIDWEAAAEQLQMDYEEVEFGDYTYWVGH